MKPKNKKMSIEEKVEGRMLKEEEEGREGGNLLMKKMQVDKDGNDVLGEDGFEEEEEMKETVNTDKEGKGGKDGKDGDKNVDSEGKDGKDGNEEVDNEEEVGEENDKDGEKDGPEAVNKSHSIARAVVNSIMPWVKVFLLKEEKDHKGTTYPYCILCILCILCTCI